MISHGATEDTENVMSEASGRASTTGVMGLRFTFHSSLIKYSVSSSTPTFN